MRRLCQAIARSPEKGYTAAGRASGYMGKNVKTIVCQVLKKPHVAAYLAKLQEAGLAKAQEEERDAVAEQAEVLRFFTTVMRSSEEETKDRLVAGTRLLDFYQGLPVRPGASAEELRGVLATLGAEVLSNLRDQLAEREQRRGRLIDVQARPA